MKDITAAYLAKKVNGRLIGTEKPIKGIFTFLNSAEPGDVVVRHWIDGHGVKMASDKGVSCLVTQNIRGDAIEIADKLELPIIITPKIEFANAFALKWAIKNFAKNSIRVVVTGTNGKSTTANMIYTILTKAGYSTYTNTDAKSEFNTLIDPVIAKQVAEFEKVNKKKIQAMVVEVSEVQGWLDKLMKDHARLMTSAVEPNVIVLTNVGLDHIGLVNSIEETYNEIYGSLKGIFPVHSDEVDDNKLDEVYAVLNSDDPLLKDMGKLVENQGSFKLLYYGSKVNESLFPDVSLQSEGIYLKDKPFLKTEELPFKSKHFIQNTMGAIGACLALNIDLDVIKNVVSSYVPLKRRFTVLGKDPLIIDDFAHNPDGIIATIKSGSKMCEGVLYIVFAIRGSRGESINHLNAEAVVESLEGVDHHIIVTSSKDVVDKANVVKSVEKNVVLKTLTENGLKYVFEEKLYLALEYSVRNAKENDTILLLGAQGMDPASEALEKIYKDINN
jgi:UDP-N-acetylmuramoyl-L-alanyl-D-glutamate--2,6-diaminopimelate ligase